jgi:hypothetical protein
MLALGSVVIAGTIVGGVGRNLQDSACCIGCTTSVPPLCHVDKTLDVVLIVVEMK